MTQTKKLTWMQIVQTILLAITTPLIIGIFKTAMSINAFIASTTVKDQVQDATISEFRIDIGLTKRQTETNRNDISYLFGILPEEKKRKVSGREK